MIFYASRRVLNNDEAANNDYLENIDYRFDLVDAKLHTNLFEASQKVTNLIGKNIFDHTLVKNHPESAVTFVENHDTQ